VKGREEGGQPGPEIVARAAAGDPVAQRALYDAMRPAVHRVAASFAQFDADDVEDVVQESFVRAFKHLAQLENPARLRPWLLTITRNRAMTRLERRQAEGAAVADLGREMALHGLDEVAPVDPEAHFGVALVRRIVDELPEGPEKETVRLFYVEGELSAREIAERLGVGKSTVTMRLDRFRAKVKLRILREVADRWGGGSGA
jgi:RNA polymerase sigma-70 factor (ECF subfamily)